VTELPPVPIVVCGGGAGIGTPALLRAPAAARKAASSRGRRDDRDRGRHRIGPSESHPAVGTSGQDGGVAVAATPGSGETR
jgi:hypothetical protein